jgi:PAS domain S-box-containing protein
MDVPREDPPPAARSEQPQTRLAVSGDVYRVLVETSPDLILVIDEAHRIGYANPAAREVLGYEPEEMLGMPLSAFVAPEFEAEVTSVSDRAARGRPLPARRIVARRRDGSTTQLRLTANPLPTGGEEPRRAALMISDEKERDQELLWELEWEKRIRRAVESGGLLAYSEPVVDLRSGQQVHEELLVRMKGRGEDIVPPTEFLPAAERLDAIGAIDRWMLGRALGRVAAGGTVAVNISARSLSELGLLDDVRQGLRSTGASPSRLIFEITETAASEGAQAARRFAAGAAKLGCRLALDDFGTGYGAMTYLRNLPAHFLKIDRDFVEGLGDDEDNQRIVRTIVDIARRYGQRTIAEGVEAEQTAALLRRFGVDHGQGHLFGKPAPISG